MRTSILSVVALGIFSIGFMFASIVSRDKRERIEQSYQSKIDSLDRDILKKKFFELNNNS